MAELLVPWDDSFVLGQGFKCPGNFPAAQYGMAFDNFPAPGDLRQLQTDDQPDGESSQRRRGLRLLAGGCAGNQHLNGHADEDTTQPGDGGHAKSQLDTMEFEWRVTETFQEYASALNSSVSFGFKGYGISASASASAATQSMITSKSIIGLMTAKFETDAFVVSKPPELSAAAKAVLRGGDTGGTKRGGIRSFYDQFGTHYLAGVKYGGSFCGVAEARFSSDTAKSNFTASVQASGGKVGFKAGGAASFAYAASQAKSDTSVFVRVAATGWQKGTHIKPRVKIADDTSPSTGGQPPVTANGSAAASVAKGLQTKRTPAELDEDDAEVPSQELTAADLVAMAQSFARNHQGVPVAGILRPFNTLPSFVAAATAGKLDIELPLPSQLDMMARKLTRESIQLDILAATLRGIIPALAVRLSEAAARDNKKLKKDTKGQLTRARDLLKKIDAAKLRIATTERMEVMGKLIEGTEQAADQVDLVQAEDHEEGGNALLPATPAARVTRPAAVASSLTKESKAGTDASAAAEAAVLYSQIFVSELMEEEVLRMSEVLLPSQNPFITSLRPDPLEFTYDDDIMSMFRLRRKDGAALDLKVTITHQPDGSKPASWRLCLTDKEVVAKKVAGPAANLSGSDKSDKLLLLFQEEVGLVAIAAAKDSEAGSEADSEAEKPLSLLMADTSQPRKGEAGHFKAAVLPTDTAEKKPWKAAQLGNMNRLAQCLFRIRRVKQAAPGLASADSWRYVFEKVNGGGVLYIPPDAPASTQPAGTTEASSTAQTDTKDLLWAKPDDLQAADPTTQFLITTV